MTECLGIMGKLFGHKFEQLFTIKDSTGLTMSYFESSHWTKIFANEKMHIISLKLTCKRCGQKKEVNDESN